MLARKLRGCEHCRGEWSTITRLWRPVCCVWCRREWFGWMLAPDGRYFPK